MAGATRPVKFVSRFPGLALTVVIGKGETARVKFAYGEYITSDSKIADGIRNHPSFGRDFCEEKVQEIIENG